MRWESTQLCLRSVEYDGALSCPSSRSFRPTSLIHSGGYTYDGTVEIAASASEVWQVLCDLSQLESWNRYTPGIEAPKGKTLQNGLVIGEVYALQYRLSTDDRPQTCPVKITVFNEAAMTLAWQGLPHYVPSMVMTVEKVQKVTALPDLGGTARCRYEIWETQAGPLARVTSWTVGSKIAKMQADTALDLKRYIEDRGVKN